MDHRGLNIDAPPFTPSTGFVKSVHSSQPAISRRHSTNPSFTPTKPTRRNSLRAAPGTNFRNQPQDSQQNHQNHQQNQSLKNFNYAEKQQAASFANDAFARKEDAVKAAAKKFAAQRAAAQRSANFTPVKDHGNRTVLGEEQQNRNASCEEQRKRAVAEEQRIRKLNAQKGYSRRHSQKMNKINAAKLNNTSTNTPSFPAVNPYSKHSATPSPKSLPEPKPHTSELEDTKVKDKENAPEHNIASSSISTDACTSASTSKSSSPEKDSAPASSKTNSPRQSVISPSVSTVTDLTLDDPEPQTPATPSLSISAIPSVMIAPSPRISAVSSSPNALSRVPSCSVDISAAPRISAVSSSDNSAPSQASSGSHRACFDPALSSGKFCPECAGVGLHIAALLTELGQQRAEPAPRSSSAAGASGNLSGWKRRMSQTLIGDRGAAKAAAEQKRLQQQVDVLSTTVSFLYEKLQSANRAGPDVDAAISRCSIRR